MLKIKVLGTGLIPRGYGLAPRKEPFMADLTLIQTILGTCPNLKVLYLNPISGKFDQLTKKTAKYVWDKFSDYEKRDVEPVKNLPMVGVDLATAKSDFTSPAGVTKSDIGLSQTGTSADPNPVAETVADNEVSAEKSNESTSQVETEENTIPENVQKPAPLKPIHSDYNPNSQKHNNQNNDKHNKK